MTFPDDSVQGIVLDPKDRWWIGQTSQVPERGSLVHCYVPHVDQVPYRFEPTGRTNPTEHEKAEVRVTPLRVGAPLQPLQLPVAAMPSYAHEVWAAYRAKRRPCVVLSTAHPSVPRQLTAGKPNSATAKMMLVAPYFGVQSGLRAGYLPAFVQRVMHGYYPQFMVDWLPHPGGEQSILRLDQLQPAGCHHDAYQLLGFQLSPTAMGIMDNWIEWLLKGSIPANCSLAAAIDLLQSNDTAHRGSVAQDSP